MRIITGKARGLQLTVPKTYDVRPTADRAVRLSALRCWTFFFVFVTWGWKAGAVVL